MVREIRTNNSTEDDNAYGNNAGRVGYTHGGLDAPLSMYRINYTNGSAHTLIIHMNWRGLPDDATFPASMSDTVSGTLHISSIPFPAKSYDAYFRRPLDTAPTQWFGSIVSGSRDASGLFYRRNRFYDANAGQFTQEDPAGLAGGLNAYGFGGGDPVTYSDPYGLCPCFNVRVRVPGASAGASAGISMRSPRSVPAEKMYPSFDEAVLMGVEGAVMGLMEDAGPAADEEEAEQVVEGMAQAEALSNNSLVCRGGTCTAQRFEEGSGVTRDASGRLHGVSVNSAPGASLEELTRTIPNKQVGVTTVGAVRAAGGNVVPSRTARNPTHATMSGISAEQAEKLFTPTIRNPNGH